MAGRKLDLAGILERDVLEITLSGTDDGHGEKWTHTYSIGEPQLETVLVLQDDPDKVVEDAALLHLVLKDQGLTPEMIASMRRKQQMMAAKAILAHFLADPDELRALPGMDKVDLLYSTGLGRSRGSVERTPRTRSSARSV